MLPGVNSGPNGEWFATNAELWARVKLPIVGWQLWYADSTVWSSRDYSWHETPREGVQVLMVHHPGGGRTIVTGRDEYTLPGKRSSKLGLMIDRELFEAIQIRAMTDRWRVRP